MPESRDAKRTRKGSVGRPILGEVHILDEGGRELPTGEIGTVYFGKGAEFEYHNDPEKTAESTSPDGTMTTVGDVGYVDEDDFLFVMGRVDDVINVAGHRLGTAEIESALVEHETVAEAAVVGYPHEIKGQGIFAYVFLNRGVDVTKPKELLGALKEQVRQVIGPVASPDQILIVPGLPKTRSGKIMRRILRNIAAGEYEDMGNLTTLADPGIVETLVEAHKELIANATG